MYEIGDLIIYGNTGVCRVMDIQMMKFNKTDAKQAYYILKPLYQECEISTPAEGGKVFMRRILSDGEALALIDSIPQMEAKPFHSSVSRELSDHYETAIKSHDCNILMECLLSIYAKKRAMEQIKKKFGALDERYMKKVEDLLFGELSASLSVERNDIPSYITNRVGYQF